MTEVEREVELAERAEKRRRDSERQSLLETTKANHHAQTNGTVVESRHC